MQVLWRDLAGYVRSPIAYSIGALFLAVQGTLFWALVELLSDPNEPAPLGAVLGSFFGGQVLYWLMTFLVAAAASMRLFADERRTGTWESLMTAPVSDAAVVVQKWLAAFLFAAALWIPTLLYPLVVAVFSAPEASLDPGTILSSYLGVLAQLAVFVAVGVAASSATRSQAVAAASTVIVLVGILLLGELPELAQLEDSWLRRTFEAFDLRGQLAAAARGELQLADFAVYAAVAVVALFMAHAWIGRGRLRPQAQSERWLSGSLVLVIAACACVLMVRHPHSFDLSAVQANRLSPHTLRTLKRVAEPMEIIVLRPSFQRFRPIYAEVDRVIERMVRAQPLIDHRELDPGGSPQLLADNARLFGLSPEQLAEGGMIAVKRGQRRVVIELLDFAEFDSDSLGVGTVSRLLVEDVIRSAVEDVAAIDTPVVCFTDVDGELPAAEPARFAELERRLAIDGLRAARVGRLGA
ncbi:MAG: ABC transporter permease subunit, partial [Deltaproteobacteria bacterium]|nr:ABC transporter permease subunit [Deltaproteobacteria bacterium]